MCASEYLRRNVLRGNGPAHQGLQDERVLSTCPMRLPLVSVAAALALPPRVAHHPALRALRVLRLAVEEALDLPDAPVEIVGVLLERQLLRHRLEQSVRSARTDTERFSRFATLATGAAGPARAV